MYNKNSLNVIFFIFLSFFSYAQELDSTREFIDFRRTDPNNLPPIEKYAQPKEQVFPLNWRNSGTGVWIELNPKVPRVNYIGLHFVNKDTGWACGGSGAIIKTTNGGDDWTISETPVNNLLLKIHSYNGQVVIATGYDGIILRSTDAGETFVQIPSNTTRDLWGVKMLNDTLGWVCGTNATLLKTTDAGQNWEPVTPGLIDHYWAVDFLNENYGMTACGGGKILKTINGGNSWTQIQAGDTRALFTIDIIDSLHIAAAGVFGKNVYSSDGGATWFINPDIPAFSATNWIDFVDSDTGYSVQDVTNIKKTTNRGQTWFNPTVNNLSNICEWHIQLLDDGTGYACGEEIGGFYALNFYKRTNWLDNWSRIFLNVNWNDVFFINETKGFLISSDVLNGGLYKTEDSGLSYTKNENAPNGNDIFFLDSLTGFIAGTHKTTDGGETWYSVNGGGTKVFFVNDQIGWSIGGNTIFKTMDVGENWTAQIIAPGAGSFSSIYFVDSMYGWASIYNRRPYKTTDSGQNWIEQTNIVYFQTRDVYFTNYSSGWIISGIGGNNLFKTDDSGTTWNPISDVIGAFRFHFFPDPVHWLINGSRRYLTEDDGNTFIDITDDVPMGFTSFGTVTDKLGYAVGIGGLVLRYNDTTYVPVELISFECRVENKAIVLSWVTASELNNLGFSIEKSFDKINWETIGLINGKGTSTEINYYRFIDNRLNNVRIFYRLKQLDYDGSFSYSQIIEIEIPVNDFALSQNYPNPANPSTNISFTVPIMTLVSIKLFSVTGEIVKEILSEVKEKGIYNLQIDLSNLATGIYFYRMTTNNGFQSIKKLIILK